MLPQCGSTINSTFNASEVFLCWVQGRDEVDTERKWDRGEYVTLQKCPSKRLEKVVKKEFPGRENTSSDVAGMCVVVCPAFVGEMSPLVSK